MYHWASVVYELCVVFPALLIHQSQPMSLQIPPSFHTSTTTVTPPSTVLIPPNFLLQLVHLISAFHPLTHTRMLEIWNDITDLQNDRILLPEDVEKLLSEVSDGCYYY